VEPDASGLLEPDASGLLEGPREGLEEKACVILPRWRDSARANVELLKNREWALTNLEVGRLEQMSLVGLTTGPGSPTTAYVTWLSLEKMLGRVVRTEPATGRVICVVYFGKWASPQRDFSGATMIHPAVGVRMQKIKGLGGGDRPQLPRDIMTLRQMWEIAYTAWTTGGQVDESEMDALTGEDADDLAHTAIDICCVCGLHGGGAIRLCALCMQSWHSKCCHELLGLTFTQDTLNSCGGLDVALPDVFLERPADIPAASIASTTRRRFIRFM